MCGDRKLIERLTKRWQKADATWKKASKSSQEATAAYNWTAPDDSAKWNRVLAKRMREAVAFQKAAAARRMLVDFAQTSGELH